MNYSSACVLVTFRSEGHVISSAHAGCLSSRGHYGHRNYYAYRQHIRRPQLWTLGAADHRERSPRSSREQSAAPPTWHTHTHCVTLCHSTGRVGRVASRRVRQNKGPRDPQSTRHRGASQRRSSAATHFDWQLNTGYIL